MPDSLRPHGLQPSRLLCPWDSPRKNIGVGGHAFLQGIFPTQELNLGFPHYREILYHLSHQGSAAPRGSPKIEGFSELQLGNDVCYMPLLEDPPTEKLLLIY